MRYKYMGLQMWVMSCKKNGITNVLRPPVLHSPQKRKKGRFCGQIHDWKHLYLRFFTYDVPRFRHNSRLTSNPKVDHPDHPAIDSLVPLLRCGKATAVFVSSRNRDFVAEVGNVVPGRWTCSFSYCGHVVFYCSSIDEQ